MAGHPVAVRPKDLPKGINPVEVSSGSAEEGGDVEGSREGLGEEEEEVEVDEEFKAIVVETMGSEEEGGVVKRLIDPCAPSPKEINDHFMRGHLPYRNWCPVCVQAQGRDDDHQRDQGKDCRLLEYHFDYCFPGDECGY